MAGKKAKYYDPVTLDNTVVKKTTQLYVVLTDEGYKIQGISAAINTFRYNPHICTRQTNTLFSSSQHSFNATHYWPIPDPMGFIHNLRHTNQYFQVFPDHLLTTEAFSSDRIAHIIGFQPLERNAQSFNTDANRTIEEEWEQDRLTESYFFERLKAHFTACITPDNYVAIKAAVDAIQARAPITEQHHQALSILNISPVLKEQFVRELTSNEFAFNARKPEYIESFFSFDHYGLHATKYLVQTNLPQIVSSQAPQNSTFNIMETLAYYATEDSEDMSELIFDESLREFIRTEFKSKLNSENFYDIQNAWQTHINSFNSGARASKETYDCLKLLNISSESVTEFKQNLVASYPDLFRLEDLNGPAYAKKFSWKQVHVVNLAPLIFFDSFMEQIENELQAMEEDEEEVVDCITHRI